MKLELEDNSQEALQFILLGAAIVLCLRLLIGGFALILGPGSGDELAVLASGMRNGYLIADDRTIVTAGGTDLAGRLALSALLAIATGSAAAAAAALYGRAMGRSAGRPAVMIARYVIPLTLIFLVYAALFLPSRTTVISNEGIIHNERTPLPGGAGLPFTTRSVIVPWPEVQALTQRTIAGAGCGISEVVATGADRTITIISTTISDRDCDRALAEVKDEHEHLVRALETNIPDRTIPNMR